MSAFRRTTDVESGFSRILIAVSLLLSLALLAGFSLLSNESAMLRVLTPVESDARQRELLLAAGAASVR